MRLVHFGAMPCLRGSPARALILTLSQINEISLQVGPEDHVICALSGGVDSAVAALLVHKVLKERLHCVFVDNGLLRYKVPVPRPPPEPLKKDITVSLWTMAFSDIRYPSPGHPLSP